MAVTVLEEARNTIGNFFHWWLGELRSLVPSWASELFRPDRQDIIFDYGSEDIAVHIRDAAGERKIARVATDTVDLGAARERIASSLAREGKAGHDRVLRLPASQALYKRIDLPAAAEENLAEVIAFDIDRQSPFSRDQVVYDFKIVGRDPDRQRIDVDLVIVARAVFDPARQHLRKLGVQPDHLEVIGNDNARLARLALATKPRAEVLSLWPRRLTLAFSGLAVALLVAAIVIPWDRRDRQSETLTEEIAEARGEAERVRSLEDDLNRQVEQSQFVLARKQQQPPVIEILDALSAILPDDTWLFRLRINEGEVQAFGYSPAASGLIGSIQNAPVFTSVEFRAPLMRDPRVEAERFHVAFRLSEKPAP